MIKDNRTIVEITSTYIKVLQITAQRNAPLLTNLEIYETKDRSEKQLIDLLVRSNIKTKNTILVLPKRNVILKHFSLPSQNEEEIRKMLSLKVVQQVPFSQEEIIFDHLTMEKTSDGYTKVLVAISPLEQIATNRRILEKAGLVTTNVLINSFGIVGWFRQLLPQEKKPLGILNLDIDGTEFCFCYQGKFLFSRNFNFGLNDLNDKNIVDILHQVELTLKAYQNEFPKLHIEKIFIASDAFQIESLKKSMLERFNLPIESIKPSERISCELQVLSLIKNNPMVSITGGWGFAISGIDQQIDLMPRSLENASTTPLSIKKFLPFLLSSIILILLIIAALSMGTYQKYLHLQKLQNDFSKIENNSKTEQQKLNNIHKIQTLIRNYYPLMDLLRDIFQKTPPGVSFNYFYFSQDYSLTIEGLSPSQAALSEFQETLKNLTWFKDINLEKSTTRQYNGKKLFEFKFKCQALFPGELKNQ